MVSLTELSTKLGPVVQKIIDELGIDRDTFSQKIDIPWADVCDFDKDIVFDDQTIKANIKKRLLGMLATVIPEA
jgi:hypothetical protein